VEIEFGMNDLGNIEMDLSEIVRRFVDDTKISMNNSTPVVILRDNFIRDFDKEFRIWKEVHRFQDEGPKILETLFRKFPAGKWSPKILRKISDVKIYDPIPEFSIMKLPDSLNPHRESCEFYLAGEFYTLKYIEDNLDADWNWASLSELSCLTSEFVDKHIDKPWNWTSLSTNYSLDVWLAVKNPTLPWNWKLISCHWATPQDIEDYPDVPWDWNMLSGSPFMDLAFFEKYIDKIDFGILSYNKFLSVFLSRRKAFHRDLEKRRRELENCVSDVTGDDIASVISLYYV